MKKINVKTLEKSIHTAEKSGFFENLYRIYRTIPQGKCSGCGRCCMESVNTYYVEFLNIYQYFRENRRLYETLFPKILRYYFLELVESQDCPFLSKETICSIYNYRPLNCRLFGHWTQEEYEENYKRVLAENNQILKLYKNRYDLALPTHVVQQKIDFCEDFEIGRRINRPQRQKMIDSIFTMESAFFMRGLLSEDAIGTGLITWFVHTVFEGDEAGDLRIQVMKEYLAEGSSETLEDILHKTKPVI